MWPEPRKEIFYFMKFAILFASLFSVMTTMGCGTVYVPPPQVVTQQVPVYVAPPVVAVPSPVPIPQPLPKTTVELFCPKGHLLARVTVENAHHVVVKSRAWCGGCNTWVDPKEVRSQQLENMKQELREERREQLPVYQQPRMHALNEVPGQSTLPPDQQTRHSFSLTFPWWGGSYNKWYSKGTDTTFTPVMTPWGPQLGP